jgi:hypothetical protein
MSILSITEAEIKALPPAAQAEVKALLGLKQAWYDVQGAYPLDNVLPYAYGVELSTRLNNAVPANGTVTASIKVSADAAFIGMSVRGASTGDFLTFSRVDNSDRQLSNLAIHSSAWMGTGERPAPLHKPLLLPANTTISMDITDLSGSINSVFLYFHGFKVYQRRSTQNLVG